MLRIARGGALRLYPVLLVLVAWQLLSVTELLGNAFVTPPPATVWDRAGELLHSGDLVDATATTTGRILLAYAAALVVGVAAGTLMGRSPLVSMATRPLVSLAFPTPKIALYPAILIVLGFGSASKLALGFLEAVFPVVLATAAATSQVRDPLVWSARSLGSTRWGTWRNVVLPAALPGILTGGRIGLVGAIIGVFVAEMISSTNGLGNLMVNGWRLLSNSDVYVAIVTIAATGLLLDRGFLMLRRRLLRWSDEADR